ncbi:copper chaperone PCu(A)C [Sphingomonas koreensis]|nr:copper chaperone PCu(A)C [Sphingomonas koreensis]TPG39695.1 copper chaperone PCu(A)C [Sphingomonas koreensis]
MRDGSRIGRDFLKRVFAILAVLSLASCGGPKRISVDHAWVRLPAVAGHPGAAYFTLHGGPVATTLLSVSSPVAIRAEMHETKQVNGMSTMAPLPSVALPARGAVSFAPAGKHVMLFNLNPVVKPGGTVPLLFVFADGEQIEQAADAVAANAPAP